MNAHHLGNTDREPNCAEHAPEVPSLSAPCPSCHPFLYAERGARHRRATVSHRWMPLGWTPRHKAVA